MISFRFHVVSLTAVFLAIAIGVIVGTTYVDRAIVENLENRIDRVSENLDERRAQIDELEDQLEEVRAYAGASADFAVTDRLLDVPVLLLAARGVEEDHAGQLATLLRRAGARTPGIVWLEEGWDLADDEGRDRLAAAVGLTGSRSAEAVAREALAQIVGSLAAPVSAELAVDGGAAVLEAVVEAGFLAVDDLGDTSIPLTSLAGSGARVVVLTGTEAAEGPAAIAPKVVAAAVDAGLPTVVAHAFAARDEGPDRGEDVWATLPEELRDRVVVIDDADAPEGRVAAVLGVAEAAAGRFGRYGHGDDVDGVLPAWSAP
jgi:hypothetical protein